MLNLFTAYISLVCRVFHTFGVQLQGIPNLVFVHGAQQQSLPGMSVSTMSMTMTFGDGRRDRRSSCRVGPGMLKQERLFPMHMSAAKKHCLEA